MKKISENGFSLLELLIVLTIISIISAISYPIYTHALIKIHRTEAKIALINLANRMEIYYLANNHSYANAKLENLGVAKKTATNLYQLALSSTANTYELSATATFSDSECHCFLLNELGEKTNTGSSKKCW